MEGSAPKWLELYFRQPVVAGQLEVYSTNAPGGARARGGGEEGRRTCPLGG